MDKLFYTIGEVAEIFKVNTSLIRFWEKEFDIIKPQRNKKGDRFFTKKDVANFFQIHKLVKEQGYTLQGAKEKLKEKPMTDDEVNAELLLRLKNVRNFLVELKNTL
ncbi:MAG: MerR family transcriptional regulator [Bacteroidales bacterium]|jgi:DNA-binding transcriptional MerR regulator|nr:MerR family transcriptional regulator [Bacteroidales bacterium]